VQHEYGDDKNASRTRFNQALTSALNYYEKNVKMTAVQQFCFISPTTEGGYAIVTV